MMPVFGTRPDRGGYDGDVSSLSNTSMWSSTSKWNRSFFDFLCGFFLISFLFFWGLCSLLFYIIIIFFLG